MIDILTDWQMNLVVLQQLQKICVVVDGVRHRLSHPQNRNQNRMPLNINTVAVGNLGFHCIIQTSSKWDQSGLFHVTETVASPVHDTTPQRHCSISRWSITHGADAAFCFVRSSRCGDQLARLELEPSEEFADLLGGKIRPLLAICTCDGGKEWVSFPLACNQRHTGDKHRFQTPWDLV